MSHSTLSNDSGSKHEDNTNSESVSLWNQDNSEISAATWCLIDHPNIWSHVFDREIDVSNNPRLSSLTENPKNVIVELPDVMAVARQFYCNLCTEIPFPWKGDHDVMMDEKKSYPQGVFLCENGHTVCRTCVQNCYRCTSSKVELSYQSHLLDGSKDPLPSLSLELEDIEMTSGSMGGWGQIRLCLAPLVPSPCFFLTDMINNSEFACQYFYNWCDFRGKGKDLQEHESQCDFRPTRPPQSQPDNDGLEDKTQSTIDDEDETAIFSFNVEAAILGTSELLEKHDPDWDSKNPLDNTVSSCRKKKKRISKPK